MKPNYITLDLTDYELKKKVHGHSKEQLDKIEAMGTENCNSKIPTL